MDFRFITPNSVPLAQADVAPAGTPQFLTGGNPNPAALVPASDIPGPYWFNGVGQELNFLLARAGITPDNTKYTLIADAIAALIATAVGAETLARQQTDAYIEQQFAALAGSDGDTFDITNPAMLIDGVRFFARRIGGANFAVVNSSRTLDVNQLGLALLDASAGQLTVTLPPAACFSDANAVPRIRLIRVDGSANQCFVQCAGSDNFSYSADSNGNPVRYTDMNPAEVLDLTGGLVSNQWYADRIRTRGRLQRFSGVVGNTLTPWSCVVPVGCRKTDIWMVGGGGSGGSGDGTNPGGGGGAAGGLYKSLNVTPGSTISGQLGFGAPAVTGGGTGNSGGTTNMVGTALYATGGFGGKGGSSYPNNAGGLGGIGAGGDITPNGASGGDGGYGGGGSGYGGQPPSFAVGTGGRAAANGGGGQAAADNAGTNGGGGGGSYGSNPGPGGFGGPGLSQVDFR